VRTAAALSLAAGEWLNPAVTDDLESEFSPKR